ncbi:alpha 1,2 mannosyltransferase [Sporothrix epigloea]|uniref:Mannosyltransferase n=1 Tax=Sporothrix epigloea TaxID=1892477 RepID=A0ABP0DDU9_9PEZI
MWRRTYLFLILIRLWFATSPSYLHPDENFQGPEVIAGEVYSYPVRLTWEFTSDHPLRSVFPLWPVYGLPMVVLRWLWTGNGGDGEIPPHVVYWVLRIIMFIMNFVLLDWAIYELVPAKRHRQTAVLLVASSYVTWTYQTHTFSNSVETLLVAWSLVLIDRITDGRQGRASLLAPTVLGIVLVFGIFNRITFPAFLLVPGIRLIPYFLNRPLSLAAMAISGFVTAVVAIACDTAFYTPRQITWGDLLFSPVVTPLNNLMYNMSPANLAQHGLHPWYQHLLANMPLLIVRLPRNPRLLNIWILAWIVFNTVLGILMGIYHQGGIIPTQIFMSRQPDATQAIWWKTYSPPIWLLDGKNEMLQTRDVMGLPGEKLMQQLAELATCDTPADRRNNEFLKEKNGTYLIAPLSATWLDTYLPNKGVEGLRFREVWRYRQHLNLDDLDWGDDGVWNTISRVVGRRGIAAWRVTKSCPGKARR